MSAKLFFADMIKKEKNMKIINRFLFVTTCLLLNSAFAQNHTDDVELTGEDFEESSDWVAVLADEGRGCGNARGNAVELALAACQLEENEDEGRYKDGSLKDLELWDMRLWCEQHEVTKKIRVRIKYQCKNKSEWKELTSTTH